MQAWDRFLRLLEQDLNAQAIDQWVRSLEILSFDARNLYLQTDDPHKITWFEEYIRPFLKKGLFNNNGQVIRVHLEPKRGKEKEELIKKTPFQITPDRLDPELTFETFVVSSGNEVPYRLFKDRKTSEFNPIYLYGAKHTGKTHLLSSLAHSALYNGEKVFYVRAETFASHVVQAIRFGRMIEFRNIYRNIDLLIVDDIHFLGNKIATQEEFFHTFNTLHTVGKQIVLAGSMSASKLPDIEQRLLSRFDWGISLEIKGADPKKILQKKSIAWNLHYSSETIDYLSNTFPNDPLVPLQALSLRAKGRSVSPELASELLKDLIAKKDLSVLTFEKILKNVSSHFEISPEDILGKSQMKDFSYPRKIAMYITREKLKYPFQKIGKIFGRDHSTVMSSVRFIEKEIINKRLSLDPFI